jgi:hypothetical protein
MMLKHYNLAGRYAPLPAGRYVVAVTEYHASPHLPQPQEAFLSFEVTPLTPTRSTRWGSVKALFR